MQVTLLGPVAAEAGGLRLPLGGRKQRSVFALLALNVNRIVSLDRLVYEIWRDEPPSRATLALQAYISRLRKVLADAQDGHEGRIVTRRPGWLLELPASQIDAVRFSNLAADGQAQVTAGRTAEGAALLRAALALWTGDPLADLDDDAFAIEDAARLQELRLDVTETLLEADLATGSDSAVITAAQAFVTRHPFRERAWCALLLALYRSGRQADALAEARRLRETLSEALGLDPSPATQRLEAMIRAHDPAISTARLSVASPPAVAPEPKTLQSDGVSVELVLGRRAELDAVVAAVNSSMRGEGRLLVVSGPAGMGKSTILRCLEGGVHAIDGLVLRGSGVGAGAAPALWPWITIVRRLREAMPDLTQAALDGPIADALALLDPSLGGTGRPAHSDVSLARTRLYRAVIDLLAAARAERPLAVVIDDAHWLDSETLDLLALATEELLPFGVLLAVALRPDESPQVRDAIAALGDRSPGQVVRMQLGGLMATDVAGVVRGVAGATPDDRVIAAIAARTGGNPFFVVELVQLLISERRLDADGVYAFLPAGVREVLRRRLDRLPEQTLAPLSVLALLGRGTDVRLLARVTAMDEDAVLDGCEAAVLAGLLLDDAPTGGFALSHDLVRQTLDETLSPARRIRLHARIGEALRDAGGDQAPERVVEIAHHLTIAAPVIGAAAIPFLLIAADDALTRIAPDRTLDYLTTALNLTERLSDPADRQRRETEIRSRLMTGRLIVPGDAADSGPATLSGPGIVAPLDPEAPAAWWSAVLLLVACGDNAGAAEAGYAAWRDDLPSGAAATVQFALGLACFELGRFNEAESCLARSEALILATPGHAPRGVFSFAGIVTVLRGCVAAVRGDHVRATALVAMARSTPDQTIVQSVTIDFWAAWCAVQEGDATRVDDLAEICIAHAMDLGESFYATTCRLFRGWAAAMRDDADGLRVADAAYDEYLSRFAGLRHQNTVQLLLRAEAYAHHGDLSRARELVHQARELAESTGENTLGVRLSALADDLAPASAGARSI